MKKKLMYIISTGVLSIGMLVGCSSGQEGEPVDAETNVEVEAPSSSDLPGANEETTPTTNEGGTDPEQEGNAEGPVGDDKEGVKGSTGIELNENGEIKESSDTKMIETPEETDTEENNSQDNQ